MSQAISEKVDLPIEEHQLVELTEDLPQHHREQGDHGVVVHIYSENLAYEVEFFENGITVAVLTLTASQVKAVKDPISDEEDQF